MSKILITGGAKNLGKILADHLMKSGHIVMIHYNSTKVKSEHSVRLDFSKSYDLISKLDFIPDVIINNAAIFKKDDFSNPNPKEIFDVNFFAPVRISQDFYSLNPKGLVINILDSWAESCPEKFLSYSLSKIALADFTKVVANQATGDFKVVGIKIGATLFKEGQNREVFDKIAKTSVEDVCKAVDFVLSEEVKSGQIIEL